MNVKKIKSIKHVGKQPVYDISIKSKEYDKQQYALENDVISHNSGLYLSSNSIFIIGRSQEKDGTDLAGYTFTLNVEKSREVREKAKFKFTVLYDKGIDLYSEAYKTNSFGAEVFGRYYFTPANQFSLFAQLGVGYASVNIDSSFLLIDSTNFKARSSPLFIFTK